MVPALILQPAGVQLPAAPTGCGLSDLLACPGAAVGAAAGKAAGSAVDAFADAVRGGVGDIIKALLTWWVKSPSIVPGQTDSITNLQHALLPVTVLVAVAALIWNGVLMAVRRKPDPLWNAGTGLFTLVLWSGAGVAGLIGAMKFADALSLYFVDNGAGNQFSQRMSAVFAFNGVSAGLTIVLGILVVIGSFVQWVLLLFRQASIVILAAFLPLAAAGSITGATRSWLRRLVSWMVTLIAYKPMVAFCYLIAFEFIGTSKDLTGVLLGFVVLILSVVALPVMLRMFSWAVDSTAEHLGSGAAGLLGGAASAAGTMAVINGYGGKPATAQTHADMITAGLGEPGRPGPAGSGGAAGSSGSSASPGGGGGAGQPALVGAGVGTGSTAAGGAGGATGGAAAVSPWLAAGQVAGQAVKAGGNAAGAAMQNGAPAPGPTGSNQPTEPPTGKDGGGA